MVLVAGKMWSIYGLELVVAAHAVGAENLVLSQGAPVTTATTRHPQSKLEFFTLKVLDGRIGVL